MKNSSKLAVYERQPLLKLRFHLFRSISLLSKLNNPSFAFGSGQISLIGVKPMSSRIKSHPVELYKSRKQAHVTRGATNNGYHPNRQRQ
mmetsp:Transcript_2071/g.3773  ORF Transcript_2071/g.3773 Transcript_2071/m.3773 type:complete len:89 (-) Transcript_2071:302-568(-)